MLTNGREHIILHHNRHTRTHARTRFKKWFRHRRGAVTKAQHPSQLSICVIETFKEKGGMSFARFISLHSDPIRLPKSVGFSIKWLLRLYKANREAPGDLSQKRGLWGRLRTSAFLQPVSPIDSLALLLLTDLDVLLDVHSWRGRDRHSWKHKKGPRCR